MMPNDDGRLLMDGGEAKTLCADCLAAGVCGRRELVEGILETCSYRYTAGGTPAVRDAENFGSGAVE